jgi:hypothetical protein
MTEHLVKSGSRQGGRPVSGARGALALALLAALLPATALAIPHPVEEVEFAPDLLTIERVGEAAAKGGVASLADEVVVRYRGAVSGPAGTPALPRLPVWVEVPSGMRVVGVSAEAVGVEEVGRVWVRPVTPDMRVGDPVAAAVPDPAIYESDGMYPASWAEVGTQGSLRGHRVVVVEVAPVRWEPGTGRLLRASAVEFTLELEPGEGPTGLERHRVVPEIEARFERSTGRLIRGFEPAAAKGTLGVAGSAGQLVGSGPAGPGPFQPSFRPTTDGSAVEYV